jgi:hypothetical protein
MNAARAQADYSRLPLTTNRLDAESACGEICARCFYLLAWRKAAAVERDKLTNFVMAERDAR